MIRSALENPGPGVRTNPLITAEAALTSGQNRVCPTGQFVLIGVVLRSEGMVAERTRRFHTQSHNAKNDKEPSQPHTSGYSKYVNSIRA